MEVNELENNYKASLKAEKAAAQEKIGTVRTGEGARSGAARCTHGLKAPVARALFRSSMPGFHSKAQRERVARREVENRNCLIYPCPPLPR